MKKVITLIFLVFIILALGAFFVPARHFDFKGQSDTLGWQNQLNDVISSSQSTVFSSTSPKTLNQNISQALLVRGIYYNGWSAQARSKIKLIDNFTKIQNFSSIIIDAKDSDVYLRDNDNIKNLVKSLKRKYPNLWLIARIVVFKDDLYAKNNPQAALKNSDGTLWQDSLKQHWIDPAYQPFWDYNLDIAKEAVGAGFDEINLDYIRFPSEKDPNWPEPVYPFYTPDRPKYKVMDSFYDYFSKNLKEFSPKTVLSADIFGYTFVRNEDLGIGQKLTHLANYFDILCPMIYPSLYDPGNFNFIKPGDHPYEVVSSTLQKGFQILGGSTSTQAFSNSVAETQLTSSTVAANSLSYGYRPGIRPWVQAFSLNGTVYTTLMIQKEIQALYDNKIQGWILWNPENNYSAELFK